MKEKKKEYIDFDEFVLYTGLRKSTIQRNYKKIPGIKKKDKYIVFPDGQEMLILVTELTINSNSAAFINKYGCDEYFKHNKDLLIHDKQQEIAFELASLKLD